MAVDGIYLEKSRLVAVFDKSVSRLNHEGDVITREN